MTPVADTKSQSGSVIRAILRCRSNWPRKALAIVTIRRAWHEQFAKHKSLARWTLPIWLYVSVTGVIVYLMLYH